MNRRSIFAIIAGAPLAAIAVVKSAHAKIPTPDDVMRIYQFPNGTMRNVPLREVHVWVANGWRVDGPSYHPEFIDGPDGEPLMIGSETIWPDGTKITKRTRHHPESANLPAKFRNHDGWYING